MKEACLFAMIPILLLLMLNHQEVNEQHFKKKAHSFKRLQNFSEKKLDELVNSYWEKVAIAANEEQLLCFKNKKIKLMGNGRFKHTKIRDKRKREFEGFYIMNKGAIYYSWMQKDKRHANMAMYKTGYTLSSDTKKRPRKISFYGNIYEARLCDSVNLHR